MAAGVEVRHAPGNGRSITPGYCGVLLRDPDGRTVEAVCHRDQDTAGPGRGD